MSALNLTGAMILIGANDVSEAPLPAVVIAAKSDGSIAALKLGKPLCIEAKNFSHAIVSVRHEGHSLNELVEGRNVICAVTFVSDERFSEENPFDLSWWRGGNAAIADVSLT